MNVNQELEFLKQATLGLFNKKGVSFALNTMPYQEKERIMDILIVNSTSTTSGNVLRLKLSYSTDGDNISVELEVNSSRFEYDSYKVNETVAKQEIQSFLTTLLEEAKGKADNVFSEEDDQVDFYGILQELSYEAFLLPDLFELNGWKHAIYLHEELENKFPSLDIPYNSLFNAFHVHGGVGSVESMNDLHAITTSVELGTLPQNQKVYLDVHSSIAKNPKTPKGLYEDASIEKFVEAVIEQYKGAWNKE